MDNLVTLDFETYYRTRGDDKLGFRSHTTEEYVRHPEFEEIGFAYAFANQEPVWFSGTREEIADALRSLELHKCTVVAHNALFDCAILNWRFDIRPRFIVDTLSMSAWAGLRAHTGGSLDKLAEFFGLGKKGTEVIEADGKRRCDFTPQELAAYGAYCCNDVRLTYRVLGKLAKMCSMTDMKTTDATVRMFTEPIVRIDGELVARRLTEVELQKRETLENLATELQCSPEEVGEKLRSADKFAELLTIYGIEAETKVTAAEKKKAEQEGRAPREVYAFAKTDKFMERLLGHDDPRIVTLAEARLGERSNIEENRLRRFRAISERGPMPIPLACAAAHTSRYGGTDKINVQNLPKRLGADTTLRRAMRAPENYKWVAADSSQIECRLVAWQSGQTSLTELFRTGGDPYSDMAETIYSRPAAVIRAEAKEGVEPGKTQRGLGKEVILAGGYQMGPPKFIDRCRTWGAIVAPEEGARIVRAYRTKNSNIVQYWRYLATVILRMVTDEEFYFGGPDGRLFFSGRADLAGMKRQRYVRLPDGYRIWYCDLSTQAGEYGPEAVYRRPDEETRRMSYFRLYPGSLLENLTQGIAFSLLRWQAFVRGISTKYPVVMNVHDEWATIVPDAEVDSAVAWMKECMSDVPPWAQGCPIACEVGVGQTYADV